MKYNLEKLIKIIIHEEIKSRWLEYSTTVDKKNIFFLNYPMDFDLTLAFHFSDGTT